MPVIRGPTGPMTVRETEPGDVILSSASPSAGIEDRQEVLRIQARAAELARQEQQAREAEIRRDQERQIQDARRELESSLARTTSRQDRLDALSEFDFKVGQAVDTATAQKVAEGFIISGGSAFVKGGRIDEPRSEDIISKRVPAGYMLDTTTKDTRMTLLPLDKWGGVEQKKDTNARSKLGEFLWGDTGKKFIGIGFPGLPMPLITAEDIQTKVSEQGLGGKVIGEFIPTTPGEVAIVGGTAGLLGGMGGKFVQKVTSGVLIGLGTLTAIDKEQPTETRIAGGLVAISPLLFKLRLPKGKKGRFGLLAEQVKKKDKFSALAKELSDTKKVKVDINAVVEGLKNRKTNAEKISDISKILKEIGKTKDVKLKQKRIDAVAVLFKEAYGETQAKNLVRDFVAQEGGGVATTTQATQVVSSISKPITKTGLSQLPITLQGQKGNLFFKEKPKQTQLVSTRQQDKQIQGLKQLQLLGQPQAQLQTQVPKQAQSQSTLQMLGLKQAQAQKQVPRQIQRQVFKQPRFKPRTKLRFTPPKIPIPSAKTRLKKKLMALKKAGKSVDIVTGMKIGKQRVIGRRLPPFRALKKASKFVDRNIEASFRLKPNSMSPKRKDIPAFKLGKKFRASKVNPMAIVERRKFRLDSPMEKLQIKQAKGKKKRKKLKKKLLSFK